MDEIETLWNQLVTVYGEERSWNPMRRIRAIILSKQGLAHREIAREVGKSASEVKRWIDAYEMGGLERLFPFQEGEPRRSYQLFTNFLVARLAEDLFDERARRQTNKRKSFSP